MKSPFASEILFEWGPLVVVHSVVTSWVIIAFLSLAAIVITRRKNRGALTLAELAVETIENELRDAMQRDPMPYVPLLGSLFIYIAMANLVSILPGVLSPTAHIETTAALAMIIFVAIRYYGIRESGLWGHLKTYAQPHILTLPFNIIGDFTRTLALMIRLFGNIMSGQFLIAIIVAFAGLLVPVPLMALSILIGLIQAYIFTILAAVFISAGIGSIKEKKELS